ncbi:hypothetical protein [Clostridium sardiniense]|uniref:hypothetical protein n=1 Tax=Clostridium sardiniense TaxID=29369 RepID=UPI0019585B7F|nr:hypothetical protein [Clostridium sardiniense]MBM7836476.1 hypothetical protein [Clostridium sardiniense]
MAKVYNAFEFVGGVEIRKDTEKFKSYEKQEFESGWVKEKLMINVKTGDSSMLVEVSDMYSSKPGHVLKKKAKGTKNEDGSFTKGGDIQIPWKDRNTIAALENVANWQKYILDFSNNKERYDLRNIIEKIEENDISDEDKALLIERYNTNDVNQLKEKLKEMEAMKHEFLSRIDLIKKIQEEIPKHPGMRFKITGNINFSQSPKDNRVYRSFEVNRIEKALDSDKVGLKGNLDIFFNDMSLDEESFEETKKYIITGYVKTYDGQLQQDIYVPQTFIMDTSKLDLNNPKHKARVNILINPFKDCDEDLIYELQYVVKFARGSEKKEIQMEDLTQTQRDYIEAGLESFEEIKKKLGGNTFGDKVDETRLIGINIKDYPDGREETDLELSTMLVDKQSALESQNTEKTQDNSIENGSEESDDDMEDLL